MTDSDKFRDYENEYQVPLPEFIETVLIRDIGRMVYKCKLQYISFGLIAQGIEFLGACLDEQPFEEKNLSERRFKKAIKELFRPINKEYFRYNRSGCRHYLYEGLRSGLTHMIRPRHEIRLTSRGESIRDGNSHLAEDVDGRLILVSEDLYDDFSRACNKVIQMMKKKKITNKKLTENYISVRSYSRSG